MIDVIIPTRGLIHTRTIESILKQGDVRLFFTYDLPIPASFNYLIEKTENDVLVLEEDIVLPDGKLAEILEMNKPVVGCDYMLPQGIMCTKREEKIIFAGTGCLFLKREVIDKLKRPIFRTDMVHIMPADIWITDKRPGYGRQDIWLSHCVRELGYEITDGGVVDHLRIRNLGEPNTNTGCHDIYKL